MTEVQIYVRKYMQLADVSKYHIWARLKYPIPPQGRPHEEDKKFFEWVKENNKFDILVVILDNPRSSAEEIKSEVRQRKLNKIIK